MNALAANAVFQAWGNTPDQFAEVKKGNKPKGRRLLEAISEWIANKCEANNSAERQIAKLVNIPFTESEVKKWIKSARGGKLPAAKGAVKWHFGP